MRSDVAVVGAGPAGAWAAHVLARHGARVALIDPSHPREKPCGGGVTGRALALVADAVEIDCLPARRIRSARFVRGAIGEDAVVPLQNEGRPTVTEATGSLAGPGTGTARQDRPPSRVA